MHQAGAPPSFWFDANQHFVFVRNRLPRFETDAIGVYVSSEEKLRGITKPFVVNNFVPFGAQVNCLIPKEARGKKTPGQKKSLEGAIVGIAEDCSAYRVWDFDKRKVREISFSFCVVSEGCFPFRKRKKDDEDSSPLTFFPTFEAFLTPQEWEKYKFSKEQQRDVLREKGLVSVPPPPPPPPVPRVSGADGSSLPMAALRGKMTGFPQSESLTGPTEWLFPRDRWLLSSRAMGFWS